MSGVLVSNVGQTESEAPGLRSIEAAQSFTTGANATGYTLTSIELRLTSAATDRAAPTVKLFRGSANGTEVATLTGPTMLDASATENYAFTPTTTVNLLTSTIYWVVVVAVADSGVSWPATLSNSEDATSATGWEIGASAERSAGSTGGFRPVRVSAFLIRVNGTTPVTNTAPTVATAILDQTATAGTVFDYTFPANTFNDADADTLTYTATQSDDSALPSWLAFDAPSARFSGLPLAADVGTVSVKVTASDGNGGSVSDTFDIVVSADTTVNCAGMCLVSNVGQTSDNVQGFAATDFAQSFTTGANATGYTLTSIELKLSNSGGTTTPTVKLYSGSANGTEEATFIGPPMLGSGEANYTFTPSSTVNLGMSTTYWVVAEGTAGVSWLNTASTSEDATPAAGWLIGDRYEARPASSTGGFTPDTGTNLQIRVNGTLGSTTVTNNAPTVATVILDQTATAGAVFSFAFPADTFNDADSDTLTYTATNPTIPRCQRG